MGARFEEDNEMHNPDAFKDEDLEIFSNIGKFEKKIGLSVNEKEIFVVNKQVDEDIWINLDTFVQKNGGILNIPLFYHTDAPFIRNITCYFNSSIDWSRVHHHNFFWKGI